MNESPFRIIMAQSVADDWGHKAMVLKENRVILECSVIGETLLERKQSALNIVSKVLEFMGKQKREDLDE